MPWVFALATASAMIATLMLGAARTGVKMGALSFVFAFCFLCVGGGFVLALLAPPVTVDSRLWLGLPQGAAVILFVVGLLPLLVLPLAYALTFERVTLNVEDLEELRGRLAEMRGELAVAREREEVTR